jgi:UDP-N-acetylmuramate--alanine ligase
VILPEEFIRDLANFEVAEVAELGDELAEKIRRDKADGYLVILMTAGPADGWLRKRYEK